MERARPIPKRKAWRKDDQRRRAGEANWRRKAVKVGPTNACIDRGIFEAREKEKLLVDGKRQPQLLHFRAKSFPADPENLSCVCTVAGSVAKDGQNQFLFHFRQRHWLDVSLFLGGRLSLGDAVVERTWRNLFSRRAPRHPPGHFSLLFPSNSG